MATFTQRFVQYCNALVPSGTATAAQREGIGAAICPNIPPEWTTEQKCEAIIRAEQQRIRAIRENQISQPGVASAKQAAQVQTLAEMPEEP